MTIPEEAVQTAAEALEARAIHVPYFTFRIMARIVLETGGPVLAAQARADERRKVAEEQREAGLVVVSAEDLDICVNWGAGAHPRTAFDRFNAALDRLRAALPERNETP